MTTERITFELLAKGHGRVVRILGSVEDGLERIEVDQNRVRRATDRTVKSFRGMSSAANLLSSAISGVAVGFFVKQILDADRALTGVTVKLGFVNEGLGGTGTAAETTAKDLAFLEQEADRLGVALGPLRDNYATFLAAVRGTSISGREARDIILSMAEASKALSLSQADADLAIKAVVQIASKGKVSLEEFTGQLAERIPIAGDAAAKALGVAREELLDLIASGEVMADDLLPGLAKELRKSLGDAAASQSERAASQMTRLENTYFLFVETLSKDLAPALGDIAKRLNDIAKSGDAQQAIADIAKGSLVLVNLTIRLGEEIAKLTPSYRQVKSAALNFFAAISLAAAEVIEFFDDLELALSKFLRSFLGLLKEVSEVPFSPLGIATDGIESSIDNINERIKELEGSGADRAIRDYGFALADLAREALEAGPEIEKSRLSLEDFSDEAKGGKKSTDAFTEAVNKATQRVKELGGLPSPVFRPELDLEAFNVPTFDEVPRTYRDILIELGALNGEVESLLDTSKDLETLFEAGFITEAQLKDGQARIKALIGTIELEGDATFQFLRQSLEGFVSDVSFLLQDAIVGFLDGTTEGFENLFKGILQSFKRMVAEMIATAVQAKLAETLFGGAGGASASLGQQAAGVGAQTAVTGAGVGITSAAALALVPIAIFALGQYLSSKRQGEVLGFGGGATVSGGQVSLATVDPDTLAAGVTDRLGQVLGQVVGLIGDAAGDLGDITILAQRNGERFRAAANGVFVGFFQTAEEAIAAAVIAAARGLENVSPEVAAAIQFAGNRTAEEFVSSLELATRIRDRGLSDAFLETANAIDDAVQIALRGVNELRLGVESAELLSGDLQRLRDQLTGAEQRDPNLDRAEAFNERIRELREESAAEAEELAAALERATGDTSFGALRFTGTLEQVSGAISGAIDLATVTVGTNASAATESMLARLQFLQELLGSLPAEIAPGEVAQQGAGRGRGRRRQRIQQAGEEIQSILEGQATGFQSVIRGITGRIANLREQTAGIEETFGRLGEALGVLAADIRAQFQDVFRAAAVAAGLALTVTASASGSFTESNRQLGELQLQLDGVREETQGWADSLEEAREATGESLVSGDDLARATEAQFTALGQSAIASLGLPFDQIRQRVGQVAGTIAFLRENQEELNISAERFDQVVAEVAEQSFLNLGQGLLDLIGDEEDLGDTRKEIQRALFDARIAQYRLEFELLAAQGLLTKEQQETLQDLFDFIEDNADDIFDRDYGNGQDQTQSGGFGGGFGGVDLGSGSTIDAAQAFLDQLAQLQAGATGSPFEQIAQQMQALRDRVLELIPGLQGLGVNIQDLLGEIDDLEAAQIAQVIGNALQPLEDIRQSLLFGDLSGQTPRQRFTESFNQAQQLLARALPSNEDAEDRFAAIQELQTLLPSLLSIAPGVLDPAALVAFRDQIAAVLGDVTGFGGTVPGGGGIGTGTGGGGGLSTGAGGLGGLSVPPVAQGQERVASEVVLLRQEVRGLRQDLLGVGEVVVDFQAQQAETGAVAERQREDIRSETTRGADAQRRRRPLKAEAL